MRSGLVSALVGAVVSLGLAYPAFGYDAGTIANPRVKYEDGKVMFVVGVQNTLSGRLEGALCVAMFDADGFEVDRFRVGSTFNLGKSEEADIADSWNMTPDVYDDVVRLDFYLAPYCMATGADLLSSVTSIEKPK
jgi:hypothetical protein